MKASVVIPVYNKAPYLQECLESVFAQRFTAFEVIAVDDASTDESLEVLRSFDDPRLRVVVLEHNVGPGAAAQEAMDRAQGEYILRVDADDIQLPDRFGRQVAYLDEHRGVGLLGGAVEVMGDSVTRRDRPATDVDLRAQLLFGVAVFQPTSAFRRSVLIDHDIRYGAHWPRYGEDWMLQARIAKHTAMANLTEPLVRYRHGPQGVSFGRDKGAEIGDLIGDVFQEIGHGPPTDAQVALHAMAMKVMPAAVDAATVRDLRRWLDALVEWNAGSGWTDGAAMHRRVVRVWDELFHALVPHGRKVLKAYQAGGGRMDVRRLYYLLRTWAAPHVRDAS